MQATGTPADAATTKGRQHDAWVAVLDELERNAAKAAHPSARRAADGGPQAASPWSPPVGIGPLPADLADRATRLLRAQLDAGTLLQEERARIARHLVTVRAVDPARPARESVYLDVLG
ncbi:hypothetical protein [Planctomonas deserti]|uniref:hypothetical protein n=1 Tax=Planctomonas deserti TaxID=2144185 RepID=UPI00131EE944|nr:hypothetical protein [Planctomonas deserti]